jgi:DNA adenine methylase
MKPLLRWAGSKTQLLPHLTEFWDGSFERYVEPFAGSAALFFALQPSSALLSDLNFDLISTYQQLQVSQSRVAECLRKMPLTESNYYRIRAQTPESLSPVEKAARFIYLNALCFNGLYRTNLKGEFNVPFGASQRRTLFEDAHLSEVVSRLRTAVVRCCDFEETLALARPGDLVYLDPPYASTSRRTFVEYGASPFSDFDIPRLVSGLKELDMHGVAFVLSYSDTPEILRFSKKWRVKKVTARRNIAGFAGNRRTVGELIISNIG